jgi:hypothetical protein
LITPSDHIFSCQTIDTASPSNWQGVAELVSHSGKVDHVVKAIRWLTWWLIFIATTTGCCSPEISHQPASNQIP